MKNFYQVLINTLIANVTTSYLWFGLTFWVYLETRSVLATGLIGGTYMLLVALFSIIFGTIVDQNRKKQVMVYSSVFTLAMFIIAAMLYVFQSERMLLSLDQPWFWLFSGTILIGAVVENMRNIALSTTVTLLVPEKRRPNANGLVGTVQGIGFMVTSVFSGLSIGLLGMGWTLLIALVLTGLALAHLLFVKIPEPKVLHDPNISKKKVDIRGSFMTILAVPGLFALIIFSTFNNLVGGVYMALMDPYGLTIFSVELWGIVLGITSTGFIIGGALIARFGLGKNPIQTVLLASIAMGAVGLAFAIRELWWLYALGIWAYMILVPFAEAAEQTVIQKVVPFKRQGRVFGFAQAFESAAAPITAFLVAPLAEFMLIPFMESEQGRISFGWLVGEGDARGIALLFIAAGAIIIAIALLAFLTKSYRILSRSYREISVNSHIV